MAANVVMPVKHGPIQEFTTKQIERIDEVENAVYDLCKIMTEDQNLEWDISFIGEIAETAAELLAHKGHRVHYPYREETYSAKKNKMVYKIHDYYEKEA